MTDYAKWIDQCETAHRFLKTGSGSKAKPKLKIRIMDDLRVMHTKIPEAITTFKEDIVNRGKWPDFADMYKAANDEILDKEMAEKYGIDEPEEKGKEKGKGRGRSPGRKRYDSGSASERSRSHSRHHRKDKKSKDKKRKGKGHHGRKSSDSDSTSVCVVFLAPPHP